MTVLPASLVLTGCQTTRSDLEAREILVSKVPELPGRPRWPDVSWSYDGGRYSLSEEDVDKVLDYLENGIPLYEFELGIYEEQLQVVLDGILAL